MPGLCVAPHSVAASAKATASEAVIVLHRQKSNMIRFLLIVIDENSAKYNYIVCVLELRRR